MPVYEVVGEYGPQAGDCIVRNIDASTEDEAKDIFCFQIETEFPDQWKKMGRGNVFISKVLTQPIRYIAINGLTSAGLWVTLIHIELEEGLSENDILAVRSKFEEYLSSKGGNMVLTNETTSVVFDPAKFMAMRVVVEAL